MAYCYECGSEIEQNDIFCPYCGISLKPFGNADEIPANAVSAESSGESGTALESGVPKTNNTENEFSLTEEDKKSELPDEPLRQSEPDFQEKPPASPFSVTGDDLIPPPNVAETSASADDFSDIPTPSIIENFDTFKAVTNKKNTISETAPSAPEIVESVVTADKTEDKNLEPEHLPQSVQTDYSPDDTNQISVENTEVKGNFNLDETDAEEVSEHKSELAVDKTDEFALEDSSSNSPESDPFDETIPVNVNAQIIESEHEISQNPDDTSETVAEQPANEIIAKPADDLEEFDPNSAQSVFDSVRIMETEDSTAGDSQNESEIAAPPIFSTGESPEDAPPTEKKSEPENLSHTTPNIGGSDTDGKKAAKLKPLDEGTVLNSRYEIVRKIGGGGMGAVYLASDNNLGGVLRAVKEMVQSYIEEEQQEKSVNDFRRESMILSTLDHVSIPTIYDYFFDEKESRFYLVMKYINGGDLSGRLRAAPEGKIDEKTVTEWAIQIADVLDYLHNRPSTIVYRDLKPANVMIDGNSGRIMLIDFGIARSINKEEKGVTAVGTMGYAPPELFSGNVEPRSDIYSLGSTMFHLLTGADPQSNPLLIFDFQKNPRPRQINSLLSDQMERILMKAVEYNSTARFNSALEMKQTLEDHLDKLKNGRVTFGISEAPASVSLENQIVFCGFCGQKIVASDMFCAFCGSQQPLSQHGVHAEIYSSTPQTAKLMIVGTSELESPVFNLDKEDNIVGRRDPQSGIFPEVDLSKFDPQTKISRRHARIWRQGENFLVEDLGSSNGTTVMLSVREAMRDSVRLLPHQPHVLTSGDKLRIGDTTLHFVRG